MKNLKTKSQLMTKKLLPKWLKIPLNGWKATKMLPLNNMKEKEKNLKKNSNQSWLKSIKNKVDKCQTWAEWVETCQIWEIWEAKVKDNRAHKLMKLIDFK